MFRSILTISISLIVGAIVFASGALAAEPQFSVRGQGIIPIAHDDSRVCCKRGNRDWWSTGRECRRAGGHETYNRDCRRDFPWEDDDYRDHRGNERVCCRTNERFGYRIFWSTNRECRRARGIGQTNKTCRKYGGFHRYPRGYDGDRDRDYDRDGDRDRDHYGDRDRDHYDGRDPTARVCCTRDGRVWWSNVEECRRAYGREATNQTCRNN
jgi:hypothetical protein